MMQELFDYQSETVDAKLPNAFRAGHTRVCAVAPCGAGKTTIIAELALRAANKGTRTLVIAHRRKLIKQLSERLKAHGVDYNVIMADLPDESWVSERPGTTIHIASRDTLISRDSREGIPSVDLLIPDEFHVTTASGYRSLIDHRIQPKFTIGFTATPCESDGSGFGPRVCEKLVSVTDIETLLSRTPPRLVPVDVYTPVGVGKRRRKGLKSGVSGDPVKQWIDHAFGLKTICFCRTISECVNVRDMYNADGIKAVHINAMTPDIERDEAIQQLEFGDIKVLVCTPDLMGVGVDIPYLECVQLLVKNFSPRTQWQTVGRCQRTAEGKTRAVLLDHAAAVFQHGMPNVSPIWSLGEDDSVQRRQQERIDRDIGGSKPIICQACGCTTAGTNRCPKCNELLFAKQQSKAAVNEEHESLSFVNGIDETPAAPLKFIRDWQSILYSCAAQGAKCVVASARFKAKCGMWPDAAGVSPVPSRDDRSKPVGEVFPQFLRRGTG